MNKSELRWCLGLLSCDCLGSCSIRIQQRSVACSDAWMLCVCVFSGVVWARSTQSSGCKEISSAKRGGGSQGGGRRIWVRAQKQKRRSHRQGKGRWERGDESASLSSFCCANVTSDCYRRGGLMIGGPVLNCKVHLGLMAVPARLWTVSEGGVGGKPWRSHTTRKFLQEVITEPKRFKGFIIFRHL